jgi:hypothetical protein
MKSTKAKPAPTKPAAPSKAATPATPAAKPEPKHGVGYHIRKIVITAYPTELTNEAINATLVASGIPNTKKSTIATAKMDCVNTLKVAQELGKLKLSNGVAEHRAGTRTIAADAPASETPAESESVLAS